MILEAVSLKNIALKLTRNKYVSYWAWILISLVLPVVIIGHKYDIGERHIAVQIGLPFMITTLWAVIRFWNEISEFAQTMKEGILREFILASIRLGPYILLYVFGLIIEILHDDYMFVVMTLLITQIAGTIMHANYKRLKRKELIDRGYVNVLR